MLLKFAIKDFIQDREYKNLSNKTIEGYQLILDMLHSYCVANEIVSTEDVTAGTIKSFMLWLQNEKNNNPTSRNSKLRTLKTFFNYLEEIEVYTSKSNPTKRLGFAKEEIEIKPFSDYHIKQILGYLRRSKQRDRTIYAYRDYMICVTLLGSGIRLGELINLKWDDISLASGSMSIIGKKRELSSIPLTEKLVKELSEYRVFCEQYFGRLGKYVFTTDRNTQLRPDAVKSIFKRIKEAMSFKDDIRVSAHTFRHTFAVKAIQNGIDAFTLQRLLRHSDMSMTSRYVRMYGTALKDQNDKFNPLNNLDI